jgi:hypothetical protein
VAGHLPGAGELKKEGIPLFHYYYL